MKTRDLVLMAMYTAMFVVLEYISAVVPILQMPQGGSVSLSGIAIMMAAYFLGFKKGLVVAVVGVVVTAMFDPITVYHWSQVFIDYPLAFGGYAFCALVPNLKVKNLTLPMGVLLGNAIRFMAHNLSGWIFFAEWYPGDVLWGVVLYNATYMIPTTIVGFIVMTILYPRLKPLVQR